MLLPGELAGGLVQAARAFQTRLKSEVTRATAQQTVAILRQRFESSNHYGCTQYADYFALEDSDEIAIARQRAFQLVTGWLEQLENL